MARKITARDRATFRRMMKETKIICKSYNPAATELDPNHFEVSRRGLPVYASEAYAVMDDAVKWRWELTCCAEFLNEFRNQVEIVEESATTQQMICFNDLDETFKMLFRDIDKSANINWPVLNRSWQARIVG